MAAVPRLTDSWEESDSVSFIPDSMSRWGKQSIDPKLVTRTLAVDGAPG
jgi:hypothetical protein